MNAESNKTAFTTNKEYRNTTQLPTKCHQQKMSSATVPLIHVYTKNTSMEMGWDCIL